MGTVDIAIPCYNYGCFLPECIASVREQDVDYRILIIDNASTDGSSQVARSLAAADARIELLLRTENLGIHASFNAGVDWASRDYFMVLCADDLLAPGSLRRSISIMDANRRVAFTFGLDRHWHAGEAKPVVAPPSRDDWRIMGGDVFLEWKHGNLEKYFAVGMILTRTAALKRAGHYRPELSYADDLEMAFRLARQGDVAATNAVQGIRRFHETNATWAYVNRDRTRDLRELLAAAESFIDHEGADYADGPKLRRLARRSIAERAYFAGLADLARRRPSHAALFELAFELDPSTRLVPPITYLLRFERPLREVALNLMGLRKPLR